MVVFEVDCSEAFLGVERKDTYDAKSDTMVISIGGQVRHWNTNWQGSKSRMVVDAGEVYSGRKVQIRQFAATREFGE
jgi:hypothetical protein